MSQFVMFAHPNGGWTTAKIVGHAHEPGGVRVQMPEGEEILLSDQTEFVIGPKAVIEGMGP